MEHLYNPEQMSEQEIKDTFVARNALVNKLVETVRQQREGAGVQHVVLVAPRGMGKTTVLLMVQFAVQEMGPTSPWLALRFPEELYGVNDLADFWLETLDCLSSVTQDRSLRNTITNLKLRYPESGQLQEAAVASLRGWCRENGRRLLLLVDNFDQILSQINDEQQNAALRNVLMNEGFLMILGAGPSFFKEASNYDQPLYNFFKIEHLNRINFEDTLELMRRRAKIDDLPEFDKILESNKPRLRSLEYFAGGNVRLILMLYHVVSKSALFEVRQGLEKLLDEVTPFFKAKTEELPPQQRKILDYVARRTSQTHEGVSPTDIAKSVRMTPQAVSTQLKRLGDHGYVEPANLRGRNSFYVLSEPLYSLWYQMRFGRNSRQRVIWLVNFLKAWYDDAQLGTEAHLLENRFQMLFEEGDLENASKALQNLRLIAESLTDDIRLARSLNSLVHGYKNLNNTKEMLEITQVFDADQFDVPTKSTLINAGYLGKTHAERLREDLSEYSRVGTEGIELLRTRKFEQFLQNANRQLDILPKWSGAWLAKGVALRYLNKPDEALTCLNQAVEIDPNDPGNLGERALIYKALGEFDLARLDFDKAIQINPEHCGSLCGRGELLSDQGQYIEAIQDLRSAIRHKADYAQAWAALGKAQARSGDLQEAVDSIDAAIGIEPGNESFLLERLAPLLKMERYDDYLVNLDRVEAMLNSNVANCAPASDTEQALQMRLEGVHKLRKSIRCVRAKKILLKVFQALKESAELFVADKLDTAKRMWIQAVVSGVMWDQLPVDDKSDIIIKNSWQENASALLISVALDGKEEFAREMIAEASADDIFFPLARALDYISTHDESLIEKLTPEMRPIVKTIIEKLHSISI